MATLFASFNGGPTDGEAWAGLIAAVLLSCAAGFYSRRAVVGAILGFAIGGFTGFIFATMRGGFLGAEIMVGVFAVGGLVLGAIAGFVNRFFR